jgi:hypothetical protein
MRQPNLSDTETIEAWQGRLRRYKTIDRRGKWIAILVLLLSSGLGFASYLSKGEWRYIFGAIAGSLLLAPVPALQILALNMRGLLKCPRCGESPGTFSSRGKGGIIAAETCGSCFAPLTEFLRRDGLCRSALQEFTHRRRDFSVIEISPW